MGFRWADWGRWGLRIRSRFKVMEAKPKGEVRRGDALIDGETCTSKETMESVSVSVVYIYSTLVFRNCGSPMWA